MSDQDCACGRPIHDNATICPACSSALATALGDVRFLAAHLRVRLTRQARLGSGGKRASEEPLPYDLHASDVHLRLHNTLSTWVRLLAGDQPDPLHGPAHQACPHESCTAIRHQALPADGCAAMAAWLLSRTATIADHEAADEAARDIGEAVRRAESAVDRTADRWYAGPCDQCGDDLYAQPGAGVVRCRCDAEYDVQARRSWLLDTAEDILASAALIARALPVLGEEIKVDRIYKWAGRGQLVPHAVDGAGRPLYRIGDVLDLLGQMEAKRERMTA